MRSRLVKTFAACMPFTIRLITTCWISIRSRRQQTGREPENDAINPNLASIVGTSRYGMLPRCWRRLRRVLMKGNPMCPT